MSLPLAQSYECLTVVSEVSHGTILFRIMRWEVPVIVQHDLYLANSWVLFSP